MRRTAAGWRRRALVMSARCARLRRAAVRLSSRADLVRGRAARGNEPCLVDLSVARDWDARNEWSRWSYVRCQFIASYALALAPGRGFSASSTNYGGCPKGAESWLPGACPIVGSYGGRDRSPMGASAGARLERTLTDLGVEHDIKIYAGVGHGFMNDHAPEDQTLMLAFLAKAPAPAMTRRPPRTPGAGLSPFSTATSAD